MSIIEPGDRLQIIEMNNEPQYTGKCGTVRFIDDAGQIHGTWGGCAIIPELDKYQKIGDENV